MDINLGLIAPVKDGKITQTTKAESLAEATKGKGKNGLDKDAFLQLLVAQMKYQDPLQPTSNTEYISQFATFSELEEMKNMGSTMELQRASGLIGQYVYLKAVDGAGNNVMHEGMVEYVSYEAGKAYISVNKQMYALNDVVSVVNNEYLVANKLAESFTYALGNLPKLDDLNKDNVASLKVLMDAYEKMDAYQKSTISNDAMAVYVAYVEKYKEIVPEVSTPENA